MSRAERIQRGEILNLKVTGKPGESVEYFWREFANNYNPSKRNRKNYIIRLYDNINNYFKLKLGINSDMDSRDELIKGIETKF